MNREVTAGPQGGRLGEHERRGPDQAGPGARLDGAAEEAGGLAAELERLRAELDGWRREAARAAEARARAEAAAARWEALARGCPAHPAYRAKRPPRVSCERCLHLWQLAGD